MANTATIQNSFEVSSGSSRDLVIVQCVLVVDTATQSLAASLFGLSRVIGVLGFVKDDNDILYHVQPSYDNTALRVSKSTVSGANIVAGNLGNGTYEVTLLGYAR